MNPRISMITLGVADLERSRRFYADGLGLPQHEVDGGGTVYFFTLNGSWLAIWPREELVKDAGIAADGSGFAGIALAHNVATNPEVDAVLEQAVRAGGRLVKPAQDTFYGGYAGYFADPDGFLWEVACNPGMPELVG